MDHKKSEVERVGVFAHLTDSRLRVDRARLRVDRALRLDTTTPRAHKVRADGAPLL